MASIFQYDIGTILHIGITNVTRASKVGDLYKIVSGVSARMGCSALPWVQGTLRTYSDRYLRRGL